jgi:ADP-heptose:LPS heptosyltransferase
VLPGHVLDLRGLTALSEAIAIVAAAAAYVGVDSGLAHVAACAGRPTVCPMPASNLGRYFPYPSSLHRPRIKAVWDHDFTRCAGCEGMCCLQPIWRTHGRGFPCVRALGVAQVASALVAALTPVQ